MMDAMRSTAGLALSLIVLLVSCGDDPPPPPPPTDSGPRDGGLDGGAPDAGPDASPDDAGPDADLDARVRPSDSGGVPVCTASFMDVHKISVGSIGSDRIVGFAAGGDSFGIVWHETRDGRPDIFGIRLSPTDGLGTEQRITDLLSNQRRPSLVASGTRWIASWVDNEGSLGFDVRTQLLNANLSPSGSVNAITVTDSLVEDNPTLIDTATGPMLLFVEDDMVGGTRGARAIALETDGMVRGTVQTASATGALPGQLAAGELTDGPVLLWSEGGDLLMQPLTAAGARSGSASTISAESNVDGTVDAALSVTGGAVVFGVSVGGVRNEVRFRAIDSAGGLVGDERVLVSPPAIARDPSIVSFAGGFAISYRIDPMDGMGHRIQLLLVDAVGNRFDEMEVAGASAGGGRTTIRATGTGQLAIAWADQREGRLEITVALIRCGG